MPSQKKINVAHVVGSLTYGGAENQVIKLLNGLDPVRFEKHLITFSSGRSELRSLLSPSVKTHNLNLSGLKSLLGIVTMSVLLKRERIHIVQSHMYHVNLYSVLAARLAGVPVVVTTEHGKNSWKRNHHRVIERRVISPLASIRIAVSNDILETRVQMDRIPAGKMIVVPNCVDIPPAVARRADAGAVVLGTVGRFVPAKDYATLLRAAKPVLESNNAAELWLVGDGPEKEDLERLTEDLGIRDRVLFTGWQPDVSKYLSRMTVFVLSSITEGIPVAMLEAMVAGIPVVATRVGGIPEVIEHGKNGLLVDPRRPEELAQAVMQLLRDEGLRTRLGDQGRQHIVDNYSTGTICDEYTRLFERLLEKSSYGIR